MPEVEYTTTAKLRVDTVWEFVKEMDNWAHFVTGYQSHEKLDETDSVWTLKGDVGVLARTLKFQVHVTEWGGPERVTFELKGLNEEMSGGGLLLIQSDDAAGAGSADSAPGRGFLARWIEAVFRFFFRRVHGAVKRAPAADAGPGPGVAKLTFRLRIEPGGPMAPMISALMRPAMVPAAEDLANKIMAHLEARQAGA
ncbi:MAG: SRPBCC family protein [Myxococcota bacterium]